MVHSSTHTLTGWFMRNVFAVAIAVLLLNLQTLQAGPPFVTDDPEPVELHHWEFYVASMHTKMRDGWSGTAPHVELNYGVVTNVQLHLIAPLSHNSPKDDISHYGYGDTEFGIKFRFIQESEHRPQVGIFPMLEIPTGRESYGLGNGHPQVFLPVWIQKAFDKWTVYGGGGYGINPGVGNQNWGYAGAVLQNQVTTNCLVGGEVYHRTSLAQDGRGDTAFNIGTVFDLTENHHILFSAGRSIDGPTQFQVYLAYQFTSGPEFFHSFGGLFNRH